MLRWLRLLVGLFVATTTTLGRRLRSGPSHPSWSLLEDLVFSGMQQVVGVVWQDVYFCRALTERAVAPLQTRRGVSIEHTLLAGLPTEVHTPAVSTGATLLYLHGGGYAVCNPGNHRDLITRLAAATGCRVVAPNYRKAPEHPFPAALDDALAACAALRAQGVTELWIAGDSAGGGLAACTMLALRDRALPAPDGVVLLSPWVDLAASGHTADLHGPLDYITPPLLAAYARYYLHGHDPRDPVVSPMYADLGGLPPTLVVLGGAETMRDQGERFVTKARAADSPVQLDVVEGMVHVYAAFAIASRAGREAIDRIGAFVRSGGHMPEASPTGS